MKKIIRYVIFILGLFINSLGVALITKANLGTSPISSIPFTLSLSFTPTIGQFTIFFSLLLYPSKLFWNGKNTSRFSCSKSRFLWPLAILLFFHGLYLFLGKSAKLYPGYYLPPDRLADLRLWRIYGSFCQCGHAPRRGTVNRSLKPLAQTSEPQRLPWTYPCLLLP